MSGYVVVSRVIPISNYCGIPRGVISFHMGELPADRTGHVVALRDVPAVFNIIQLYATEMLGGHVTVGDMQLVVCADKRLPLDADSIVDSLHAAGIRVGFTNNLYDGVCYIAPGKKIETLWHRKRIITESGLDFLTAFIWMRLLQLAE